MKLMERFRRLMERFPALMGRRNPSPTLANREIDSEMTISAGIEPSASHYPVGARSEAIPPSMLR